MDPMNQFPSLQGGPPPPQLINAKEALNIPSLLLILMGAIGVVLALINAVMYLGGGNTMGPLLDLLKDLPPESRKAMSEMTKPSAFNWASVFVSLVANAFIAFGALQMRSARSYGLSLAAAIVAMVPCLSCCCLVGLPLGIWAIVTMNKPEIRAQFT